ncbi:MAG: EamA family transporter, partial [bacterium]|nr:EamA family transporter [bacterium]
MTWFFIAIFGHTLNGIAFIVDKILLQKAFKRSATYAGLVGILSLFSIVVFPWVETWPTGFMLMIAILSGATFIFALRSFFASLNRAEASRVVPIVGSLIPIFTLVGSALFLHERLTIWQGIGFTLLILATIILSGTGKASRPQWDAIRFAIFSSILFAVSFVAGKAVYDASGFLGGFLVTRLSAFATALFMVTVLDRFAGREILSIF